MRRCMHLGATMLLACCFMQEVSATAASPPPLFDPYDKTSIVTLPCTGPKLKLATFNVRFDPLNPSYEYSYGWSDEFPYFFVDANLFPGEPAQRWEARKVKVGERLLAYDIVGAQEVKFHQGNALACLTGYKWVGEGRESYGNDVKVLKGFVLVWVLLSVLVNALVAFVLRKVLGKSDRTLGFVNKLLDIFSLAYSTLYLFDVYPTSHEVKECSRLLLNYWAAWGAVVTQYFCSGRFVLRGGAGTGRWKKFLRLLLGLSMAVANCYVSKFLINDLYFSDEYSPIFMKPHFTPRNSKTITLNSNTSDGRLATEWGAGCVRVLTTINVDWDGEEVHMFNTHFDHVSEHARREAAKKVNEIVADTKGVKILTGDFNTYVGTDTWYMLNRTLADSFFTSVSPHDGPLRSFHNWNEHTCGRAIDWIFVSRNVTVERRGSVWSDGASDHNIVGGDFLLDGQGRKEDYRRRFSDCTRY